LCADQLQGNPVIALYEWPPFVQFLAATMGKQALYPMQDPMARVNVQASRDGEALNWHFDRSEFTTTILLQAPQAGGRTRIPQGPAQRRGSEFRWRRRRAAREGP